MSGFSIATEVFAFIPSYENRKIDIYKDAKASDNVSGQMFYYTPLFSLITDDDGNPTVEVDGKNVEILFQCYTEKLQDLVLTEVRERIGDHTLKSSQIGLIPMTGIEINPESEDVAPFVHPSTGLNAISLSEKYKAHFQFSDKDLADKFARRVKERHEDFQVKLTIPSVGTVDDRIEISGSDLKKVDWQDFVNEKNAKENIDANNQYFTIDQLSDNLSTILRRININVVEELNDQEVRQLSFEDKNMLLKNFIEHLTKGVDADLDSFPPNNTEVFINKESFKPDLIKKETMSISTAMTSAFDSLIDKAEEDIKDDIKWSNRKSLLEQLKESYENKKGSGDIKVDASVFDLFSGSSNVTANYDFTQETLNAMKKESAESDFTRFSSTTKNKMKSELKSLLQKNSSFNWEFEGEKVIPKKIRLKRIIRGQFSSDCVLLQKTRTIKRTVTKVGFAIDSKINLINVENQMLKELEHLKAEIDFLKAELSSKASNSSLANTQNTANDAVNRANNAQNTANDAVNRANNAQNTANDAVSRANNAQNTANSKLARLSPKF